MSSHRVQHCSFRKHNSEPLTEAKTGIPRSSTKSRPCTWRAGNGTQASPFPAGVRAAGCCGSQGSLPAQL